MIVAVIPAKGGSKRLKDKNIFIIKKNPLFYWSVKTAQKSKLIKKIFISTDSKKIENLAKKINIETIKRPKKLGGETPIIDVYRHAFKFLSKKYSISCIVGLQPDHPDRSNAADKVIKTFKKNKLDELFCCDKKGKKNGAYYIISRKVLIGQKPVKQKTIVDECTNIHFLKDLKKAEKNLTN
jgi:N-acylneuraminate cytidylyltransferase